MNTTQLTPEELFNKAHKAGLEGAAGAEALPIKDEYQGIMGLVYVVIKPRGRVAKDFVNWLKQGNGCGIRYESTDGLWFRGYTHSHSFERQLAYAHMFTDVIEEEAGIKAEIITCPAFFCKLDNRPKVYHW